MVKALATQGHSIGDHGCDVVEKQPASLILDDSGMIRDCNRASEALFSYRRSEMVWRHISMLLPQLANMELMQNGEPNARLRFLSSIGRHFQAVPKNGEPFPSKLFLNVLSSPGQSGLLLIVGPQDGADKDGGGRPEEGAQILG